MKLIITIMAVLALVWVSCDEGISPFGPPDEAAGKMNANTEDVFMAVWDCEHEMWTEPQDSTFTIFYGNFSFSISSNGLETTEYLTANSKQVYQSGNIRGPYDRHSAIFRYADGQCGFASSAFVDTSITIRIFERDLEWRYRGLPLHSEYAVDVDGELYRIARVNADTSLRYTDYWSLFRRNNRPPDFVGRYYLPLNFDYEQYVAGSDIPHSDEDLILNPFIVSEIEANTESGKPEAVVEKILDAVKEATAAREEATGGGDGSGGPATSGPTCGTYTVNRNGGRCNTFECETSKPYCRWYPSNRESCISFSRIVWERNDHGAITFREAFRSEGCAAPSSELVARKIILNSMSANARRGINTSFNSNLDRTKEYLENLSACTDDPAGDYFSNCLGVCTTLSEHNDCADERTACSRDNDAWWISHDLDDGIARCVCWEKKANNTRVQYIKRDGVFKPVVPDSDDLVIVPEMEMKTWNGSGCE